MKKNNLLILICCIYSLFVSCDPDNLLDNNDSDNSSNETELASDYDWNAGNATTISLNNNNITSGSDAVTIAGSIATITKAGYYIVNGTLTNGQLIVAVDSGIVKIQFDGVNIANTTGSPFYIKKSSKTILFLADGSSNMISDASSYVSSEEPNAAIFSNSYLAITGNGSLTVKGNFNDAISTDDELIINNGTITATGKDDAIRGKNFLKVNGGTITATGGTGHALKSDNTDKAGYGYIKIDGGTLNLASSSADGIHAVKRVIINSGNLTISATGSQALHSDSLVFINDGTTIIKSSKEGIESPYIVINGGELNINATDDGFNSTFGNGGEAIDKSCLTINGGKTSVEVVKGDGLDSNGTGNMTGGTVVVHGPSSAPEVALDVNGDFKVTGGTMIASGPNSGNMIEGPATSSSQYSVLIKFGASSGQFGGPGGGTGTNQIAAGTIINIRDSSGNSLISFVPVRACYYVIFSSPLLKSGSTYTVYTGSTVTGETIWNGYYQNGTATGGTSRGTFTVSGKLTTVNLN